MKQLRFKVEEFYKGEWQPCFVNTPKGKVQRVVKITQDDANSMNKYSSEYGTRYVLEEEVVEDVNLDELKAEYEKLAGKKPHHLWKAERIIEELETLK